MFHVKVRICCHKLCIYFQPSPTFYISSVNTFFHCATVNISWDSPASLTVCAFVIVIVKIVLSDSEITSLRWRVCLRAPDHIYILFFKTLLNFMPSSQFHALLCSSLSVTVTVVTLLTFYRYQKTLDLTSNKNIDGKLSSNQLCLLTFAIWLVIFRPMWPVSWLGLCPQFCLSLPTLYYGACGYVTDMLHCPC